MRAKILSRVIVVLVLGTAFGFWRHQTQQRYYLQGREAFIAEHGQRWDRFYAHPHHLVTVVLVTVVLVAVAFGIYELLVADFAWPCCGVLLSPHEALALEVLWSGSVKDGRALMFSPSFTMKCFYHQDRDAVGTCKSCGKGLCPECAVDLGKGLACRSRCEDDAKAVISLIDQNIKLSPRTARLLEAGRGARAGGAIFLFVMGAIFVFWGLTDKDRFTFLIILGVSFLAFGAFSFLQSRWIYGQK